MGADPAVWHFVTAPRAAVDEFGGRLGLTVVREGAAGVNITHNLRTASSIATAGSRGHTMERNGSRRRSSGTCRHW